MLLKKLLLQSCSSIDRIPEKARAVIGQKASLHLRKRPASRADLVNTALMAFATYDECNRLVRSNFARPGSPALVNSGLVDFSTIPRFSGRLSLYYTIALHPLHTPVGFWMNPAYLGGLNLKKWVDQPIPYIWERIETTDHTWR